MNWQFWKTAKVTAKVKLKEETGGEITPAYEFPCSSDSCLVRMACTKACDKIEIDDDKLMELFLKHNCCPDCGSEQFMEGPSGGMSTNVRCAGCKHWFNMSLPVSIERIHISGDGVFR